MQTRQILYITITLLCSSCGNLELLRTGSNSNLTESGEGSEESAPGITPSLPVPPGQPMMPVVGSSFQIGTYVVNFNKNVTGYPSPVEPHPMMFVGEAGLEITSATRVGVPNSEISVFRMPDVFSRTSFQPYSPNFPEYNSSLSVGPNYPVGKPTNKQIFVIERLAAIGSASPILRTEGNVFAVLPSTPTPGAMFPSMGPPSFRNRDFLVTEVEQYIEASTPAAFVTSAATVPANNPITHFDTIDTLIQETCKAYSFLPPYTSISGAATIVHRPPNWIQGEEYGYGGSRHKYLLRMLMGMADRFLPIEKRKKLAACFVQNFGLNFWGGALLGAPTLVPGYTNLFYEGWYSEGGGHPGGLLMATEVTAFLLRSHTAPKNDLDLMNEPIENRLATPQNPMAGAFYESAYIHKDPQGIERYSTKIDYGRFFSMARCLTNGLPPANNWYYCLSSYGSWNPADIYRNHPMYNTWLATVNKLKVFDSVGPLTALNANGTPVGGGYFATGIDAMSSFSILMKMIPAFETFVGPQGTSVRKLVDRMLQFGPHTYEASLHNDIVAHLQHSAQFSGDGLSAFTLTQAQIDATIAHLQAQNGYTNIEVTVYGEQWVRNWLLFDIQN